MANTLPHSLKDCRIGQLDIEDPAQEVTNGWVYFANVSRISISTCPLHAGEVLTIGRYEDAWPVFRDHIPDRIPNGNHSSWYIKDSTISAVHLKIYSIRYDEHDSMPPLVFAEDLSSNGTQLNGRFIGNNRGAVLLNSGDRLKIGKKFTLIWKPENRFRRSIMDVLTESQANESTKFARAFYLSPIELGQGGFGKVVLAENVVSKKQLACKIVDVQACQNARRETKQRKQEPPSQIEDIKAAKAFREVDVLRKLSREICHPNIVRLEKVYHNRDSIYIFEELVAGGDLMSLLAASGGKLSEGEAAAIIKQVLEAVKHLHERDIIHRDIKPENVLLSSRCRNPRAVLADFGHAIILRASSHSNMPRTKSIAGTYGFVAPEVLKQGQPGTHKGYSKAVDMWSIGCLTYVLLAGCQPFGFQPVGRSGSSRLGNSQFSSSPTESPSLTPPQSIWTDVNVSSRARDFIQSLLVVNEDKRMTVEEALKHHWLTNKMVRDALEDVYQQAIRHKKKSRPPSNIIEELALTSFVDGGIEDVKVGEQSKHKAIPAPTTNPIRNMMERLHGAKRSRATMLSECYPFNITHKINMSSLRKGRLKTQPIPDDQLQQHEEDQNRPVTSLEKYKVQPIPPYKKASSDSVKGAHEPGWAHSVLSSNTNRLLFHHDVAKAKHFFLPGKPRSSDRVRGRSLRIERPPLMPGLEFVASMGSRKRKKGPAEEEKEENEELDTKGNESSEQQQQQPPPPTPKTQKEIVIAEIRGKTGLALAHNPNDVAQAEVLAAQQTSEDRLAKRAKNCESGFL